MENISTEWKLTEDRLVRNFKFKSFSDAVAFIVKCSDPIEKLDHHPEWRNVYNRIEVELTTHDADGVSEKDYQLAKVMDDIFNEFFGPN